MNMRKYLACGLILSSLIANSALPTWAAKSATPEISSWAMSSLNEGERYGIYPLTWYYEDFRIGISNERLNMLVKETGEKLAELKLEKKKDFVPAKITNPTTREGVLTALYNEAAQYQLPESFMPTKVEPIEFMKNNQIVLGDKTGLQLGTVCTTEQATIFATKLIQTVYHQLGQGGEGFLWKATNGDTTVYLLGSIHVADTSIYPMDKGLIKAYESSEALLVEANLFDQQGGMAYMQQNSVYTDKTMLKDVVSKETYEKTQKAFEKFKITEETYGKLKPWVASNTLAVLEMSKSSSANDAAQASNLGIDMYYLTKALIDNKPIVELEGLKFQTDMFNNLSPKLQETQLAQAADAVLNTNQKAENGTGNEESDMLSAWLKQWKEGNIADFTKTYEASSQDSNEEYTKMLFGERDKNMAIKLSDLLDKKEKKTYFVVVGSGHLALKGSVVDRLKEKGYSVEVVDVDKLIQ
jgi:hypothetical protein